MSENVILLGTEHVCSELKLLSMIRIGYHPRYGCYHMYIKSGEKWNSVYIFRCPYCGEILSK